jgi:hypothetical protein
MFAGCVTTNNGTQIQGEAFNVLPTYCYGDECFDIQRKTAILLFNNIIPDGQYKTVVKTTMIDNGEEFERSTQTKTINVKGDIDTVEIDNIIFQYNRKKQKVINMIDKSGVLNTVGIVGIVGPEAPIVMKTDSATTVAALAMIGQRANLEENLTEWGISYETEGGMSPEEVKSSVNDYYSGLGITKQDFNDLQSGDPEVMKAAVQKMFSALSAEKQKEYIKGVVSIIVLNCPLEKLFNQALGFPTHASSGDIISSTAQMKTGEFYIKTNLNIFVHGITTYEGNEYILLEIKGTGIIRINGWCKAPITYGGYLLHDGFMNREVRSVIDSTIKLNGEYSRLKRIVTEKEI